MVLSIDLTDAFPTGVLLFVAVAVPFRGYWMVFEGGESAQTLGKRLVGIRVRAADGRRAGYRKAIVRNLVFDVIWLIPFANLVDGLWPLWDDRNQ